MDSSKDFKYNKEEVSYHVRVIQNSICKTCRKRDRDSVGPLHGYEKATCEGYPDLKPLEIRRGKAKECPKFEQE